MAHEHPSNLPGAYDRNAALPQFADVIFRSQHLSQAEEMNEVQSIARRRAQRLGDMVARDGDRLSGAQVVVDLDAGTVTLTSGLIYAAGDVRSVDERVLVDVDFDGDISIGIRIVTTYPTDDDIPDLRGLHPGSKAEGQPGAARSIETATWSLRSLAEPGVFYQVYTARDGVVLDQTEPSNLSQIAVQIAANDRGATGGNYIVNGNAVTAIAQVGSTMQFSIGEGEANIRGFKRTRFAALRYAEPLSWDTQTIVSEPHLFEDGGTGTAVITLNNGPIAEITSLVVTKQITETITRGSPNNSADALGQPSATVIISVVQGGTTYVAGTSYTLAANAVNWAAAGAEPAVGTSYQVTYRYLAPVSPVTVGLDTVTASGGVTGQAVFVGYRWKLPRIDRLCLNELGEIVYLRGISAGVRPQPPIEPSMLLGLADIYNDWRGLPAVTNNGVRAIHFAEMWRYFMRLFDLMDLVALERLKSDIDSREPVAKRGMFVDPFIDDTYRDAGVAQTAAVYGGSLQLALDPTLFRMSMAGPIMLDYTEEVIVAQERRTGCVKINPYANFTPLPAQLDITPAVDFWTETRTTWLSDQTRNISGLTNRNTVTDELVDRRSEPLAFLRQISIAYTISGFGPGEALTLLAFDGIVITPAGPLVGDVNGEISSTFVIPANVVAGTKYLYAVGASGAEAWAEFVGLGTVDVTTMRRIVTVELVPPPPAAVPVPAPGSPEADPALPQNVMRRPTSFIFNQAKDPQAESFILPEPRHVTGIDIKMCEIGNRANGLSVELVPMRDGDPTSETMAAVPVPMGTALIGAWLPARWKAPVFLNNDRAFAGIIKTDDNEHAISIADLGGYDVDTNEWVGANPYTLGNRHSSSNALSWDHHQGSDITFRLWAARFTAPTKTVVLGTVALVAMSDIRVQATVDIPSADCSFYFEIVRASGEVIRLLPNQPYEFKEYVTETVTLRAVLKGTATLSPTLYPGVTVVASKLRATGDYVTRAMDLGTAIRLTTRMKALLPAGSAMTFSVDKTDNVFVDVPLTLEETLNDGWKERKYNLPSITAAKGRLKIVLTGTPAARPSLADLRAVMV